MSFNKYLWNLYKESNAGIKMIEAFQNAKEAEDQARLLIQLNPLLDIPLPERTNVNEMVYELKVADYFDYKIQDVEDANRIFYEIMSTGLMEKDGYVWVKPGDYKGMLRFIPDISFCLYLIFPDFFLPFLFILRFNDLKQICEYYDLELPQTPTKYDYKKRAFYYMDVVNALFVFRDTHELTSAEMCAFLYDFALQAIDSERKELPLTVHNRLWISGTDPFKNNRPDKSHWGSNPECQRGDLVLMYETVPASVITSLWVALSDASEDPFFDYHASAYLQHVVDLPPISLIELKNDNYFSSHPLIRRNMKGVNGILLSSKDYLELKRMWSEKGIDVDYLPELEHYEENLSVEIVNEKDVEEKLLIPLLHKLYLESNKDYIRQLPIKAGRGHRIYPDFALFYNDTRGEETAKVIIEAKYEIKSNKEKEASFKQAKSYGRQLESELMIICDRQRLLCYPRYESFNSQEYLEFTWKGLEDPDIFNRLKFLILPRKHDKFHTHRN